MIRKFLHHIFSFGSTVSVTAAPAFRAIAYERHGISRSSISAGSLKVALTLQQAGYSAYIVGGAVRDLLLGLKPKDYDIVTDATPEEVRAIFRHSRIIGRRFRLVHVMSKGETVEVSTFRGKAADDLIQSDKECAYIDATGRLLHDNFFGSQEEDVRRRDFTINALFYNPATEEIIDYLSGFEDVMAKRLSIIGDPEQRYREDPVRMLRAVRLAAKLGIQIDDRTAAPIGDLAPLLLNVPAARLFDEMLKLLFSGHALTAVIDLRTRGLHHGLLPMLDVILEQPLGERFISLALKNTDERVRQGKPVSPGFLFAALLWHEVLAVWNIHLKAGEKNIPALLHRAMGDVLAAQRRRLAIPRRHDGVIYDIWSLQPRFLARAGRKPFRLLEHPHFPAAYDFMLLRCKSGEIDEELGQWWQTFKNTDNAAREAMLLQEAPTKRRRKRRRSSQSESVKVDSPINQDIS
ncbi:poly(A) polymerase [Nitrosomonas eutropha]|uniref:polynucleotide adenylyltransferase PcnB n=1 Tax=Nitrosomonas eutropha TaxID=916 RepID=UPI00088F6ED2|nr:polynucleotide adenylyltransferase PcnB [Nitrosomonas eutropha]SCX23113.1 poly(A) polymerase [Nitrosomonas eutropha]